MYTLRSLASLPGVVLRGTGTTYHRWYMCRMTHVVNICDPILLKKSLKSGRVKIKIAKVTTNGTTRLHAMMDIYGLFWGSTGA